MGELDRGERTFDEIVTLAIETAWPGRWNDPEYAGLGVADRCRAIAAEAMSLPQEARDRLIDLAEEAEAIAERQEDGISERQEAGMPRLAELKEELQRISNALCGIQLGIEGVADWQYGLRGRKDCRSEKMVDLALLVRVDYYSLLRHMEKLEQLAWADEGGF